MTEKLAKKVSYAFGSHTTHLLTFHIVGLWKAFFNNNFGLGSVIHSYPFVS